MGGGAAIKPWRSNCREADLYRCTGDQVSPELKAFLYLNERCIPAPGGRAMLHTNKARKADILSQRHIMANHLARYPELVTHYFSHEYV
jgi:hypothetical protein